MKSKYLFFVLIFLTFISKAQYTQTVRGVVVDAQSQSPLPGAIVIVDNNQELADVTGTNGEFRISNVPIGYHNLKVTFIGYEPLFLKNIEVKSGKETVLTLEIEESVVNMDVVVVKAKFDKAKPLNDMASVSARSVSTEETNRFAGTWLDPARMVSNYAGVAATGDQRNDIIIRGNSPLGLLWRLEGTDIPNPNHFGTLGTTGGPVSILNNNLLDNSDFFTGAFPAEYGNAIAGVFDLKMRKGNNEKNEYTAQISMNGLEFMTEGPFSHKHKASYLASYRYSDLSFMKKIGVNFGVSGVPQYQDLSFYLYFPNTKAGNFSIFGVGGISYIEAKSEDRTENDWTFGHGDLDFKFGSDMGVLGISNKYFFGKNSRLNTTIAVSGARNSARVDSAFSDGEKKLYYVNEASEIRYAFNSKYTLKINAKNTFNAGFIAELYTVNYIDSVLLPTGKFLTLSESDDENMILFQNYVQLKHKFSKNLSFYSGLHYQYFTLNDSYVLEPRFSIKWNFIENQSISAAFGKHSQLQPRLIYFTKTILPDGSEIFTNKNLDFSKSDHYVIGYDIMISENLHLKLEAYYQHLYSIPVESHHSVYSLINYGTKFFEERRDSLLNDGTGKNYGIELTFEKFLSDNYYFLFTSSIFDSKYVSSDGIERNTAFNGNYVFNLLGGYGFDISQNSALLLDVKTVYAGGKRYIPIDLEASKALGKEIYDYSKAYEPQYDDYFRLDGRFSFKTNFRKTNMEIALDVQNLTNHKNILLETYDPQTNSIRYDYQFGLFYVFLFRVQF